MLIRPWKVVLNVGSAYLFIVSAVKQNIIAAPAALFSLLILIAKSDEATRHKIFDTITIALATSLIIFSILNQNFT